MLELLIFAVLVIATRYVSLGSVAAAVACPFFAAYYFLFATFAPLAWLCTTVAALTVVWAHRENIDVCAMGASAASAIRRRRKGKWTTT